MESEKTNNLNNKSNEMIEEIKRLNQEVIELFEKLKEHVSRERESNNHKHSQNGISRT